MTVKTYEIVANDKPLGPNRSRDALREVVESIAVALILALLFRSFVAEAFVIPTGSMAPTLMGRHVDLECPDCGFAIRGNTSFEIDDEAGTVREKEFQATECLCPNCRKIVDIEEVGRDDQGKLRTIYRYKGDRIIVGKFPYQFSDPNRFDVVVFHYPLNAKTNYIKRLLGLPGETVCIYHGNIYTRPFAGDPKAGEVNRGSDRTAEEEIRTGQGGWKIAQKPADKVWSTMHIVHENDRIDRDAMVAAGWPARWRPDPVADGTAVWKSEDGSRSYAIAPAAGGNQAGSLAWLRYHHCPPTVDDRLAFDAARNDAERSRAVAGKARDQLIADFVGYNTSGSGQSKGALESRDIIPLGVHWVGDLAMDAKVAAERAEGELLLELIEGDRAFTCALDLQKNQARMAIEGLDEFHPTASIKSLAGGEHRLTFANVDDQLILWIDGSVVQFDTSTSYPPLDNDLPSKRDLQPAGLGVRGTAAKVQGLRVLRDIYYIATDRDHSQYLDYASNSKFASSLRYEYSSVGGDSGRGWMSARKNLLDAMSTPESWARSRPRAGQPQPRDGLFDSRHAVTFNLGRDQFLMLGDNSPQSSDSRAWPGQGGDDRPSYAVTRELLIGKALIIYWPHSWEEPVPFLPNFSRMGLVR